MSKTSFANRQASLLHCLITWEILTPRTSCKDEKSRNYGFLLKNNYKIQSILLVRQRFKYIWFLIIRVLCTRFCPVNLHLEIECLTLNFHTHLEIECLTLDFLRANRVLWTRFVRNEICFKPCLTNNIVWVL